MPSAIQYYDELKASSALDQETMLWDKLDSDLTGRRVYDLEDQLCDILFRIRLEKYRTASHALTSKQIIPEERNF